MKLEYEPHDYTKSEYQKRLANKRLVKRIKEITLAIGEWILILAFLWMFGCNVVQALKCPSMTHTQLLLHLPKTIMLDFQIEPNK
jgi:hypothetical protein